MSLQLTKLELWTSPGLAPSDLVAITTRVAASTLQKNAISGMSAVYRGASHGSILLRNAPIRENVSRLFNNFYYCYELVQFSSKFSIFFDFADQKKRGRPGPSNTKVGHIFNYYCCYPLKIYFFFR